MATEQSSNLGVPLAIFLAGVVIAGAILVSSGFFEGKESPPSKQVAGTEVEKKAEVGSGETSEPGTTLGEQAQVPVSEDDDSQQGSDNAPVLMIEFSDYQCPFCKRFFEETYKQIVKEYIETGKLKYVFRDFPLAFHANAQKAAESAECADDQNKYWEYHDRLFENQQKWEALSDSTSEFESYAKALGLNADDFKTCLSSGKYTEEVKKDYNDGVLAGVNGTPGFFINGKLLVGAQPFSAFKQLIDEELKK